MDASDQIEKLEIRLAKSEQALRDMWERAREAERWCDAWAEKAAEAGQYIALNKALGDRLGVYMTRLAEAREVLKEVEWSEDQCPYCKGWEPHPVNSGIVFVGHASDCKLAKCLEGVND